MFNPQNPGNPSNPFAPQQPQYPGANPFAPPQGGQPFGSQPSPFSPAAQPMQPMQPQYAPPGFAPPGFAPPAAPVDLAAVFAGMGSADESNEKLPPLPAGGHRVIEIGACRIERSTNPQHLAKNVVWFKADITAVESDLCAPGTRAIFIEKVNGHDYPSQKADSLARVRCFVAGAMGRDGHNPEVRAEFEDPSKYVQIMQGVAAGNLQGKRLTCTNVYLKPTKPTPKNPQGGFIALYTWAPLGTPVQGAPRVPQAPAQTAAPSPGFQSQGPSFPPAGWQALPQYPGYFTGFVNGQQVTVSENDLRVAQAAGKI